MAKRVLWRSWCKLEAGLELEKMHGLPMQYQWVDGHQHQPGPEDIWLTTNGYDYKNGRFKKVSLYAESFIHLRGEYQKWNTNMKWNHRFHFNPIFAKFPNCTQHNIGCWWKKEIDVFEEAKESDTKYVFGMVLGDKGVKKTHPCDNNWYRHEVVKHGRDRSLMYYGTKWPLGDKRCGGEKYIRGHRGTPEKFTDARRLMINCKFVFALENIYDKHYSLNYLTEKIFHGFLSNSVPIYLGAGNVDKILDPSLFIDIRKFGLSMPKVMDHCEKMSDNEYNGYLERIEQFLRGEGQNFAYDSRFVELDGKLKRVFG